MTRRLRLASARDVGGNRRHDPRPAGGSGHRRRDMGWRLCGVLAIAAAGITSLIHRDVLAVAIQGPPSGWEIVLGLTSFVLASLGVLLLIHGAALRDGWVRPSPRVDPFMTAATDPAGLGEDRSAVASILAARAIRAAAATRTRGDGPRSDAGKPGLWTSPPGRA